MLRPLIDLYTLGQCQKIPGFTQAKFKEEARDMYKEINRLIALNHHTALRSVCSEKAMSDIKREVKAGGGERVTSTCDVRRVTPLFAHIPHEALHASRFALHASLEVCARGFTVTRWFCAGSKQTSENGSTTAAVKQRIIV